MSQRIRRRYWNYWEYKDERLEVPPEHVETAFNKKKNTKKWCKGKKGVEHETVIEIDTKRLYGNKTADNACGFINTYGRGQVGTYVKDEYWLCRHQEVCTKCGKIVRWNLPNSDCPKYAARSHQ